MLGIEPEDFCMPSMGSTAELLLFYHVNIWTCLILNQPLDPSRSVLACCHPYIIICGSPDLRFVTPPSIWEPLTRDAGVWSWDLLHAMVPLLVSISSSLKLPAYKKESIYIFYTQESCMCACVRQNGWSLSSQMNNNVHCGSTSPMFMQWLAQNLQLTGCSQQARTDKQDLEDVGTEPPPVPCSLTVAEGPWTTATEGRR